MENKIEKEIQCNNIKWKLIYEYSNNELNIQLQKLDFLIVYHNKFNFQYFKSFVLLNACLTLKEIYEFLLSLINQNRLYIEENNKDFYLIIKSELPNIPDVKLNLLKVELNSEIVIELLIKKQLFMNNQIKSLEKKLNIIQNNYENKINQLEKNNEKTKTKFNEFETKINEQINYQIKVNAVKASEQNKGIYLGKKTQNNLYKSNMNKIKHLIDFGDKLINKYINNLFLENEIIKNKIQNIKIFSKQKILSNNFIVSIYNIKQKDVNKKIHLLNSSYDNKNKELCIIFSKGKEVDFNLNYKFDKENKYKFTLYFNKILKNMSNMFSGCSSLISLNLSNFKTYKVTKYANIFDSLKKDCKIISNDNKLLMIWEIFASYN